jgi:hypothetical protein
MNPIQNKSSFSLAASRPHGPVSLVLCFAVAFFFVQTPRSVAQEDGSPEVIAADVLIVRPVCLAATIIGAALFVVSLPISIASKSTGETCRKLVGLPARATFTRPLGEMSSLTDR